MRDKLFLYSYLYVYILCVYIHVARTPAFSLVLTHTSPNLKTIWLYSGSHSPLGTQNALLVYPSVESYIRYLVMLGYWFDKRQRFRLARQFRGKLLRFVGAIPTSHLISRYVETPLSLMPIRWQYHFAVTMLLAKDGTFCLVDVTSGNAQGTPRSFISDFLRFLATNFNTCETMLSQNTRMRRSNISSEACLSSYVT